MRRDERLVRTRLPSRPLLGVGDGVRGEKTTEVSEGQILLSSVNTTVKSVLY